MLICFQNGGDRCDVTSRCTSPLYFCKYNLWSFECHRNGLLVTICISCEKKITVGFKTTMATMLLRSYLTLRTVSNAFHVNPFFLCSFDTPLTEVAYRNCASHTSSRPLRPSTLLPVIGFVQRNRMFSGSGIRLMLNRTPSYHLAYVTTK